MLMRALILLLLAGPAFAQSYLPQTTVAAAQTRSHTQAAALCQSPCATKDLATTPFWWPVIPLTNPDGSGNLAYIKIVTGDACQDTKIATGCGIGKNVPSSIGVTGLSAGEMATLLPAATVSPVASITAAQLWAAKQVINLKIAAFTDPRNEAITYAATGLPVWLSFDPIGLAFTGTVPPNGASGSYTLIVTGTDASGFSVTSTISGSVP